MAEPYGPLSAAAAPSPCADQAETAVPEVLQALELGGIEEAVRGLRAQLGREIDIVISRRHVLTGNWQALYDEMAEFRAACGPAHVKAILATGELGTLRNVARASLVCMMAGADFVKTSTGKEKVNATFPVGLAMAGAIRAFLRETGFQVGLKPAGGIRSATDGYRWLRLVKGELGEDWSRPLLFRIGASGLVTQVVSALATRATS